MQTLDFLEKVLPHEGRFCFTLISGGKVHNHFVDDLPSLSRAAGNYGQNSDFYHACSSFDTSGTEPGKKEQRTKNNAIAQKAIWADLDIGDDDSKYASVEEAIHGLHKFLDTTKLPLPLVLSSGYGVHIYWPLHEAIPTEVWRPYAVGFKELAKKSGFKIDGGITADAARILRTPGTFNFKYGAKKPVRVVHDAGPFDVNKFAIFKISATQQAVVAAASEKKEFTTVNVASVLKICNQMREFRDGVEQTGELWVSCGRILAQCTDGEKIWHEWSAKDPRYNDEEAAKKWKESLGFNNATTCEHFKKLNTKGCEGCPVKTKTPLQAARGHDEYVVTDVVADRLVGKDYFPYVFNKDASLVLRKVQEEGEPDDTVISQFPFILEDRGESELTVNEQTVSVAYWRPHEGWASSVVEFRNLIATPQAELARLGIAITHETNARAYIIKAYSALTIAKKMTTTYDSFGWKGNKFLLGNRLYSFEEDGFTYETVPLSPEVSAIAVHMKPRGQLDVWRDAAQSLFAQGHEWQAVTLLAGAGAPLLALMDDVEGGTIWSLFDSEGGKGKTLATVAAASVWGNYSGLSTSVSDTVNARMAKLGILNNLPLAYDEMKRDNPAIARDFVQAFTVGKERDRLNMSAKMVRNPRSWRTIMLTSANSELTGAISAADTSEAMSDRVFEVHASKLPLGKGEIDPGLKNVFIANAGHLGYVVLALVLRDLDGVRRLLRERETYFLRKLDNSKGRFKAQLMAAVHVVGKLLSEAGVLTFDQEYYDNWLLESAQETANEKTVPEAQDYLSRYLREHAGAILYTREFRAGTPKSQVTKEIVGGKICVRIESDTHQIIIPRKDFEAWLQKRDRSIRDYLNEAQATGLLLERNIKKNLGAGTFYATGQEYCIVFNANHRLITGDVNVTQLVLPPKDAYQASVALPA